MRSFFSAHAARVLSVLLVLTLFAAPATAEEDGEKIYSLMEVAEIIFDGLVLRPLGGTQTLMGVVFFAVAAPVTVPLGQSKQAWKVLVEDPYDGTFARKLGDI